MLELLLAFCLSFFGFNPGMHGSISGNMSASEESVSVRDLSDSIKLSQSEYEIKSEVEDFEASDDLLAYRGKVSVKTDEADVEVVDAEAVDVEVTDGPRVVGCGPRPRPAAPVVRPVGCGPTPAPRPVRKAVPRRYEPVKRTCSAAPVSRCERRTCEARPSRCERKTRCERRSRCERRTCSPRARRCGVERRVERRQEVPCQKIRLYDPCKRTDWM